MMREKFKKLRKKKKTSVLHLKNKHDDETSENRT